MDFVKHNLEIEPIKTGGSAVYRLSQMHGPTHNPTVSSVFLTDYDIRWLVESWLKNSGSKQLSDWLSDKRNDLYAAVKQQPL